MTQRQMTVSVRILDKEYQVACPPEQIDELTASARYLDSQMQSIRDAGKVLGVDRMAVMAALNISHELLRLRSTHAATTGDMEEKIDELNKRLDRVLAEQNQLAS